MTVVWMAIVHMLFEQFLPVGPLLVPRLNNASRVAISLLNDDKQAATGERCWLTNYNNNADHCDVRRCSTCIPLNDLIIVLVTILRNCGGDKLTSEKKAKKKLK